MRDRERYLLASHSVQTLIRANPLASSKSVDQGLGDLNVSEQSTAYHEAGHAWSCWTEEVELRLVTIRTGETDVVGKCYPSDLKTVDIGKMVPIAAAGPITEAIYTASIDDEAIFDDHLFTAFLNGGGISGPDYRRSLGFMDSREYVCVLVAEIRACWGHIEALASTLTDRCRFSGDGVLEVFDSVESKRIPPRTSADRDNLVPDLSSATAHYPGPFHRSNA